MPKYDLPTEPHRYVTIALSQRVEGGVVIGGSDIVEYAVIIGHAALSELNLPQDRGVRIAVFDRAEDRAIHSGMLDSEGMPVWDGRPLLRRS